MHAPEPPRIAPAEDRAWSLPERLHRIARLGPDLVLIELGGGDLTPAPGALTLCVDGVPLPPPTASLRLDDPAGGRLLFLCRDTAGLLQPGVACDMYRAEALLMAFSLAAAVPATALLDAGRPGAGALLRFLVRTAAPATGRGS